MQSVLDAYHALIAKGEIAPDPAQEMAAAALQRLQEQIISPPPRFASLISHLFALLIPPRLRGGKGGVRGFVKGIYLHGGVGRGKSMLMDLFYDCLSPKILKRRVHFHEFMIETHSWLHTRRAGGAVDNLLPRYADYVAKNTRVLCFDEFHVTDVADAMILSRLFAALFERGLVMVATSNWVPDRLYEGGLQRERFLPFIALIKERLKVFHLDNGIDYRKESILDLETYLYPLNAQTAQRAQAFFRQLSGGAAEERSVLRVKGRDIPVVSAGGVARFSFADLCEKPYGAEDYLAVADAFHAVFVEGIPRMGYDRNNEAKRLMTLVDVLYDARRRAVFTAESPPEKIYHDRKYAYEFERTISRLREMQSSYYAGA